MNEKRIEQLAMRVVGDMGGAFTMALGYIGDRLGLYTAMAGEDLVEGTERFFRPGYLNFLVKDWLGAVPGLVARLEKGAQVADIGCGCGQSTVTMAKAFPRSRVLGIDYDPRSIARACRLAAASRVANVEFLQAPAHEM